MIIYTNYRWSVSLPVLSYDIEDILGMNDVGHQRTPGFPNKEYKMNVSMVGFLVHETAAHTQDMS